MVNYLKLSLNDTSILAGEGSESFWTDVSSRQMILFFLFASCSYS